SGMTSPAVIRLSMFLLQFEPVDLLAPFRCFSVASFFERFRPTTLQIKLAIKKSSATPGQFCLSRALSDLSRQLAYAFAPGW
ncbi:MAG: hypothetical protein QGF00_37570, partial [Planctomycetota bacterium]|nr:hypothetical protein [Planctomycetota bacterium]